MAQFVEHNGLGLVILALVYESVEHHDSLLPEKAEEVGVGVVASLGTVALVDLVDWEVYPLGDLGYSLSQVLLLGY